MRNPLNLPSSSLHPLLFLLFAFLCFLPAVDSAPPVVVMENYPLQYSYYGPTQSTSPIFDEPVTITNLIYLTDSDSTHLSSATFTFTSGFIPDSTGITGDVLTHVDTASITGVFDGAAGTLTLSGTALVSEYQTALRLVLFKATSDYDVRDVVSLHTKVFDVVVVDADTSTSSVSVSRTILVTGPFRVYTTFINFEIISNAV